MTNNSSHVYKVIATLEKPKKNWQREALESSSQKQNTQATSLLLLRKKMTPTFLFFSPPRPFPTSPPYFLFLLPEKNNLNCFFFPFSTNRFANPFLSLPMAIYSHVWLLFMAGSGMGEPRHRAQPREDDGAVERWRACRPCRCMGKELAWAIVAC